MPSSTARIVQISNGGTTVAELQLTTVGKLRLRNGGATIGNDSATLTGGTVYRVMVHQKKGTGSNAVLEASLATGDDLFGSPFASATNLTFTTQATRVNVGATTSSNAVAITVDDIIIDSAALPPPSNGLALRSTDATALSQETANTVTQNVVSPAGTSTTESTTLPAISGGRPFANNLSGLPLSFVTNAGQTDRSVRFQVRGASGTMFFAPGEAVFAIPAERRAHPLKQPHDPAQVSDNNPIPMHVVRMRFDSANNAPAINGINPLPGTVSFLQGSNPKKWSIGRATYGGVEYQQLYSGIDLRYEGTDGHLKSTYIVASGGDPARIRWRYTGATSVQTDVDGNLVLGLSTQKDTITATTTLTGTLIDQAPVAWQVLNGERYAIDVAYVVAADASVSFAVGLYDHTQPLIIDPTLSYGVVIGGQSSDDARSVAVDSTENIYVVGTTYSSDFPTATLPPSSLKGTRDVFISKINPLGTLLLYSTYLGGTSSEDGLDIAVDSNGSAYVTGVTYSSDFPLVNAYQSTLRGSSDAFVTKIAPSGTGIIYSTYLGGAGADTGSSLALDSLNNMYIAGQTDSTAPSFPVVSAYQVQNAGGLDGFITKLNASGSAPIYSTFLGGQ